MNSPAESRESLLTNQELAEENNDTLKDDVVREKTAVNFRLKSLGLYIFVRGFRRAYKRRGLYIFVRGFRRACKRGILYPRGLLTGIKKRLATSYSSAGQKTFCMYGF